MSTSEKPRRLKPPGRGLLWSHIAATLLTVAEFSLLQAVAIGLTTVVYLIVPQLDAKAQPGFDDWIRVFQIVSPTLTVSGGAAIVISSYIYAKKAQEYYEIAERDRERAERERERAERAEAEVARLTARLAQLENGSSSASS